MQLRMSSAGDIACHIVQGLCAVNVIMLVLYHATGLLWEVCCGQSRCNGTMVLFVVFESRFIVCSMREGHTEGHADKPWQKDCLSAPCFNILIRAKEEM